MLRASGTAACVRASSPLRSPRELPSSDSRRGRLAADVLRAVGHELHDRRLERRRVDELPLTQDRAAQRRGQLAPRREAVLARGRERAHDDLLELGGDVLGVGGRRLDDAGAHDVEQRLAAEAAVQRAPAQDLPQDHAERVEVAPPVDALAARLLRGHVAELALEDALLLGEEARARDPEIGDLHGALEREQDVLRAHVAVHDLERLPRLVLLLVRVVQALRGLRDDPRADPRRDLRAVGARGRHQAPEVASLDVLHREEEPLVAEVLEFVDLDDVGVVEARREVRLLDEHRAEAPRSSVRRQDPLEDEHLVSALRAPLLREEHLGHAARPQAPHDLELRDLLRGHGSS
jgi:hypothetical protein